MAEQKKTVFSTVLDSIKRNRLSSRGTANGPVVPYQSTPKLDPSAGVEQQQQDYIDWQVSRMSHDLYTRTVYYDVNRISAYQDFRAMDKSPEIATALHIITDECLVKNELGNILQIYSENVRVKNTLDDMFKNVLNIEHSLKLWIRELAKYGDHFVYLAVDKDQGVYDFMTLPTEEIHREEGYDGTTDSVRFRWETTGDYFEEWQIAHFRRCGDTRMLPYGVSLLDPARKLWKQLQLAEDSALTYRITRAPERRVFYIDVGNIPESDVKQYISKVQNSLKRNPVIDQRTGNMNYKFDPGNVTEDYYIPIRGDKSSKIETLPGAQNMSEIEDIEYLQNKLFCALQVPKTYLNYSEHLPGGSTLSQADLRFSRLINSIQDDVLLELRRIANVHLHFLGLDDDIDNFKLTLTNPSTQQELLKLETMKVRLEVFKEMFTAEATSPVSYTYAMENILGFSKHDIKLILKQKKVEKKIFAEIDSAIETYKKIGLFKEIDAKFEDPNAAAQPAGAPGDEAGGDAAGGGGGSSLGAGAADMDLGNALGGLPGGEAGGAPDAGGGAAPAAPASAPTEPAAPLTESTLFKNVFEMMVDELLEEKMAPKKEDKIILKSNNVLTETKKLIAKINRKLGSVNTAPMIIEHESKILDNNQSSIENTQEIFDKLDKLTNVAKEDGI